MRLNAPLVLAALSAASVTASPVLEERQIIAGLLSNILKGTLTGVAGLIKDVLSGKISAMDDNVSAKPRLCLDTCCACKSPPLPFILSHRILMNNQRVRRLGRTDKTVPRTRWRM